MFKRHVQPISDVINELLRVEGLETPLLQRRLIASWDKIVGTTISKYTDNIYISNQTLMVKITNPALRQDLSMLRTQLVKRLNAEVGSIVIMDVRIY
jgi:hypothetical protein